MNPGRPSSGTKISVVVPARNEQDLLPECLAHLREQSLGGFELIVVDSASTDRTAEVGRSWGARVVSLPDPGVGRARQAGFDVATGTIIATTDADAVPPEDWLERLVAPFRDPAVVCSFGTIRLTREGLWMDAGQAIFSGFQGLNLLLGRPLCCGANFAVRKEAFMDVGGFHRGRTCPDEGEDIRLARKLQRKGKVVLLPDLAMAVSPRSFGRERALRYLGHSARVYVTTCWLERTR
jgi:glycosyltransferase involved in cell wall biosynthesis